MLRPEPIVREEVRATLICANGDAALRICDVVDGAEYGIVVRGDDDGLLVLLYEASVDHRRHEASVAQMIGARNGGVLLAEREVDVRILERANERLSLTVGTEPFCDACKPCTWGYAIETSRSSATGQRRPHDPGPVSCRSNVDPDPFSRAVDLHTEGERFANRRLRV